MSNDKKRLTLTIRFADGLTMIEGRNPVTGDAQAIVLDDAQIAALQYALTNAPKLRDPNFAPPPPPDGFTVETSGGQSASQSDDTPGEDDIYPEYNEDLYDDDDDEDEDEPTADELAQVRAELTGEVTINPEEADDDIRRFTDPMGYWKEQVQADEAAAAWLLESARVSKALLRTHGPTLVFDGPMKVNLN